MTPPTDIGKEPPKVSYDECPDCGEFRCVGSRGFVACEEYEAMERRALAAEGLLREAWKNQYLVEWEARVAQHFAGAEGEK